MFTTLLLVTRTLKQVRLTTWLYLIILIAKKVLATVVAALYAFFDKHPDAFVYVTGSTSARTRLYRMGITKFYEEMVQDFDLYGQVGDEFYDFEIDKDYAGFLAQRKFD